MLKSRVRLIEKGIDGSFTSSAEVETRGFEEMYRNALALIRAGNWLSALTVMRGMSAEERQAAIERSDADGLETEDLTFPGWLNDSTSAI